MATEKQTDDLRKDLRDYRRKYIKKEYLDIDESATRIMVNHLLSKVFGYEELKEIKTEYLIRGSYADYVIQLKRKKHFIVEVKSIQLDLNDNHLRQSVGYAVNEGIDWALLTNGKELHCYHIEFSKPIRTQLFFAVNFSDMKDIKAKAEKLLLITKKSINKGEINEYWKKFISLKPQSIAPHLYSEYIARHIRRELKKSTGVNFSMEEIIEAIAKTIKEEVDTNLRLKY